MNSVIVLGGYGGFGARLSRRLAADGWEVWVAGRNPAAATALAAGLPGAHALVADRAGDLGPVLRDVAPRLLIDAAGPFQGSDHRVAAVCIAAGVHYLDLADARDFVTAIVALDAEAREAGVAAIAGASSVPALSGAVVRFLADGMTDMRAIDIAISASNRATAGASVAGAILSYVGQPVRLWRGRRWRTAIGWHDLRREAFVLPGEAPLVRRVALADVPDHALWPDRLPDRPATTFRAGPEFAFQLYALAALGWLVRWRLLPSLVPLKHWLLRLQRLTGGLGTDRSAMKVVVKGMVADRPVVRDWTLLADGDGPEIPVLAAQLLARAVRDGTLAPGARDAGGALTLDAFAPLLAGLAVRTAAREIAYEPLYARVMGDRFARLPAPVRAMHAVIGDGGAQGVATVTRGPSPLARLAAWLIGFPPAGDHALHVAFAEHAGIETWTRDFGGHRFTSELSMANGRLIERFGPLRFRFDLPSDQNGLAMAMRGWSVFHVPLPLALAPRSPAREWADGDDFVLDVPIALPLIGPVVHYRGRLRRV